ncbi:MAG: HEAT repeat domain-containing protein [Planctomycetes bacterium]|nr:HEAT repeat domain-containing protein [Planctomycetota bacterium]
MRRALPIILAATAALAGCKKAELAPGELSVEQQEWVMAVSDELQNYEEARKAGLLEDQSTAKHKLMRIADDQREQVMNALQCNRWEARKIAAGALGFSGKDDVIQPLIDVVKNDADIEARKGALWGLSAHGSDQTPVDPIVVCLGDPDAELRAMALGTLSKVLRRNTDRGALPRVLELLTDADWTVRGQAALVLATVGRKDTIKILTDKTLKDDNPVVRLHAVGALLVISDAECIDPLIGGLTDADPRVADTAQRALEILTGQKFGKEPEKWLYWWKKRQELGMGLDH